MFEEGDNIFQKVHLMKGVTRFEKVRNLWPRYFWSYHIIKRIDKVAYEAKLQEDLAMHNMFHVSYLQKYVPKMSYVLEKDPSMIKIREHITYEECPVWILAREIKQLRKK